MKIKINQKIKINKISLMKFKYQKYLIISKVQAHIFLTMKTNKLCIFILIIKITALLVNLKITIFKKFYLQKIKFHVFLELKLFL